MSKIMIVEEMEINRIFNRRRNYNTMIEEDKEIFINAGVYESINIIKIKFKYNNYKYEITRIENWVN